MEYKHKGYVFFPLILPLFPKRSDKGNLIYTKKKERKKMENLCIKFVWLQVQALLEVLPNKLTADVLEQLRISKQTLVQFTKFVLDRVV